MVKLYFLPRQRYAVAGFFLFISLYAHSQDILWEKSLGGIHSEYLFDAVPTADYGFILAGSSLSGKSGNKTGDNAGDLDYWVWKMDEKGDLEWQKSFGGSGSDFLQSVKLTDDGGFILAGNSDSPNDFQKKEDSRGGEDFWIIKLDAGGGEMWQRTIGGIGQDKLNSIFQTRDGGYILGGSSNSVKSGEKTTGHLGNMDYWIVKLAKDGKTEWQKTFGGIYSDELKSIEQTRDNGYIIGGYSNSPASDTKREDNIGVGDYWVIKLDKKGETEWEKVLGGDKDDELSMIHQTHDGGFIVGGNSNSSASYSKKKGNGKGSDFWIIKLKTDGENDWQETYDFGKSDILTAIVENEDGTYLVGGYAKAEDNGNKEKTGISDFVALKISAQGEFLWQQTVGSDGDDALRKLIMTRDGGYILAGTSNPTRQKKFKPNRTSTNNNSDAVQFADGEPNGQLQETTGAANEKMNEITDSLNEAYDETVGSGIDKINKATDTGDSPFQVGINKPQSPVGKSPQLGGGNPNKGGDALGSLMSGIGGPKSNLPASGDKKTNFGSDDFWVVKLLDKKKPKKERVVVEATPNPAGDFTNVVIGYEYEKGAATVVDMSGHVLQQFEITGQTVPVNLTGYPQGIYIVNIKTNVQSDGVKVIKRGN